MQDMLKNTWVEHPDYGHLKDAVLEIKDVALFVESAQERFHNMNKIISIQSSLIGKKTEVSFPFPSLPFSFPHHSIILSFHHFITPSFHHQRFLESN